MKWSKILFLRRGVPIFLEEVWNVSNNDRENEISEELVHHNIESKYTKMFIRFKPPTPCTKDQNALLISFHAQATRHRHHCCFTPAVKHSARPSLIISPYYRRQTIPTSLTKPYSALDDPIHTPDELTCMVEERVTLVSKWVKVKLSESDLEYVVNVAVPSIRLLWYPRVNCSLPHECVPLCSFPNYF